MNKLNSERDHFKSCAIPSKGVSAHCSTNIEQFLDMGRAPLTAIGRTRLLTAALKGPEFATSITGMPMLRLLLIAAGVVVSVGCAADTATQEPQPTTSTRAEAINIPTATSIPQNPADLGVRRDLNLALADDVDLRNREIQFIVTNGDVSVTGTVRTEAERKKFNDLAMNIGAVKSVANALRVAE
jgi:hypothetical protein